MARNISKAEQNTFNIAITVMTLFLTWFTVIGSAIDMMYSTIFMYGNIWFPLNLHVYYLGVSIYVLAVVGTLIASLLPTTFVYRFILFAAACFYITYFVMGFIMNTIPFWGGYI